jgi:hypothetical protein
MVRMVSFGKYLLAFLFPLAAFADLTIFDMRKNLPMSDGEAVYRDYIINGGSEAGLSVGMTVTVQRRLPLYDSYQNRSAGDLSLKVAKIKIIYVQKGMAVARLQSEFTRESTPILEDNFIMIGDRLDLSTATDAGDKKGDQASAESKPEQLSKPVTTAAAAPAQIVVNHVELSSTAPATPQTPKAKEAAADVQVLR